MTKKCTTATLLAKYSGNSFSFELEMTSCFRSFEAFSGRKIQLDTEVWSCEVTGKSNITYDEAVQSEREARAAVKKVDKRLTRAILYLANKATGRTVLQKLANEIMAAIKDIFFLGKEYSPVLSFTQLQERRSSTRTKSSRLKT